MTRVATVFSAILIFVGFLWLLMLSLILQTWTPLQNPVVIVEIFTKGSAYLKFLSAASLLTTVLLGSAFFIAYMRQHQNYDMHGDARFANWNDLTKYKLLKQTRGLILGYYLKYGFIKTPLIFDVFKDAGHFLLVAPTRSGKGTAYVIPTALTWTDSVLFLDVKGEIFDHSSGYRAAKGQKILRFAPMDKEGHSVSFNPLHNIGKNDIDKFEKLGAITECIWPESVNGKVNDDIWYPSARTLFKTIFQIIQDTRIDSEMDQPVSIPEILDFTLAAADFAKHLKKMGDLYWDVLDPSAKQGINDFMQKADKEQSGVLSTFKTKLGVFESPVIAAHTRHNSIDFSKARKEKMSIYFVCPPRRIKVLAPLIRMFFDHALDVLQEELPEENDHKVLFLMDEFARFGQLPSIKEGISDVAGYNIVFMPVVQNYGQLQSMYQKEGAETFLANCKYRTFYAPNEPNTADFVGRMLGTTTVKNKSVSKSKSGTSISTSESKRELMNPAEIMRYDRAKAIVLGESQRPISVQKLHWYKHPELKKRILPPHEGIRLDLESVLAAHRAKHIPMNVDADDEAISDDVLRSALDDITDLYDD